MHTRRRRALAVGVICGVLAGAIGALTHLILPAAPAVAADPLIATGVAHRPWYGLAVVHAAPRFHDAPGAGATAPPPPALTARAGILVDIDSGDILWQRDAHTPLPPASTTKVMTALVVLANYSPDTVITVTPNALGQAWDETRMGLRAGERLTVRDLLTGMLLVSANDAASVLADDTVGHDRFVAAMNAQEEALGLSDSHFTTPVGLDTPGHAISAYDEAAIATVAMTRYPLMEQIASTPHAVLPATADHQAYDLWNINLLLPMYPGAVGVKPGYTGGAGYCLVGMAVRGNHRLISVLLNAQFDYRQSAQLLDWGFHVEGLPPQLPPTPSPHVP